MSTDTDQLGRSYFQHENSYENNWNGYGIFDIYPDKIKKKLVNYIFEEKYEKATDIWFQDEGTDLVWVLRNNMHWQLNRTGSKIWLSLDEKSLEQILTELTKEYSFDKSEMIKLHIAEFLIVAYTNGIIKICDEIEKNS